MSVKLTELKMDRKQELSELYNALRVKTQSLTIPELKSRIKEIEDLLAKARVEDKIKRDEWTRLLNKLEKDIE